MRLKVSSESVSEITNSILQAINGLESSVSTNLKRAFYFKGRKSEEIATKVIEALTTPGEVILDPFFGGGSFIIGAVQASRFIYGIELDNYTYDAVKSLLTIANEQVLTRYFEQVQELAKNSIMNLYRTRCCGQQNYIKKLYFDPADEEYYSPQEHRDLVDGKNVVLMEKCPICQETRKRFVDYDYTIIQESLTLNTEGFPRDEYIENSRINITASTGANRYDRLFTVRNQHALLLLQRAVDSLPESVEKAVIQHALVSSLALARISMYGSSTDVLYHVISHKGQDMNVWYLFDYNFKCMVKFKDEYSDLQVNDVEDNGYFQLLRGSYRTVLNEHPEIVADLIYTDFPYTDQVPYLERNQLFRKWLERFGTEHEFSLTEEMLNEEIVVTDAPSRSNKGDLNSYYRDIDTMFQTLRPHLNVGKLAVFTMKLGQNKYIRTFSEIINLARKNGFEYITRIGLTKTDPTLRKQSAYANTFMNEMIVVFQKLEDRNAYWYVGEVNYEFVASKLVYQHLVHSREVGPVTVSGAAQIVQNDLLARGHVLNEQDSAALARTINENFLVSNGFVEIDSNRLYLDIEDRTTLFVKLYDLIPLYIRKLLSKEGHFLLEDLYLELTNSLCDGSSSILIQILEDQRHENAIRMILENYCTISNGYYIEKPIQNTEFAGGDDISQYSGTDFEILMKRLLDKEGYLNIVIMGGAGDRGVDLVCSKLENKELSRVIFQCKRWIGNVGSEPIQRLFAEQQLHQYHRAICVTTSNFTSDGRKAAEDFNVEMWDGLYVMRLLEKHFAGQYYNRALDIQE